MSNIIGRVVDAETNESLFGANVVLANQSGKPILNGDNLVGSTIGGSKEMYDLDVPRNPIPLGAYIKASFVGYEPKVVGIDFSNAQQNDIKLSPSNNMLEEVVITANKPTTTKTDGKVKMTLGQTPIQAKPIKKGWSSFSKMKKGIIIAGSSVGFVLLVVGLSMTIKKNKKN